MPHRQGAPPPTPPNLTGMQNRTWHDQLRNPARDLATLNLAQQTPRHHANSQVPHVDEMASGWCHWQCSFCCAKGTNFFIKEVRILRWLLGSPGEFQMSISKMIYFSEFGCQRSLGRFSG